MLKVERTAGVLNKDGDMVRILSKMKKSTLRAANETETSDCQYSAEITPWGEHRPNRIQKTLIWSARSTFLHRGKLRHKMTRLITSLHSPIDVEFRDCRYRIEGQNNLAEYGLLLHPGFNAEEIDFLLGGLSEGGVAVDIGANIGLYSLPLASRVGPTGRVISIDANPGMIRRLTENAKHSHLDQVTPVCVAVGGHEAMIDLYIQKDDVAIVNVVESTTGKLPMRPLKSILADCGISRVDVMKIDIEGYEDAALVPYFNDVDEPMRPQRIVIEGSGPDNVYPGCKEIFGRFGYRMVGYTRANQLFARN